MPDKITTICAFLCLFLSASTAFAAWPDLDQVPDVQPVETPDVAVVVGVEDYLLLPDIPGAIDNVNDWEVFLRQGLGVPTVHVLADRDVTRESMLKFARTASADVGDGGTIWWIFIGHGAPAVDGEDGLLVGVDAQQSVESLTARGLPQGELLDVLGSDEHPVVMIVDACFSGRDGDGRALAAGVQPVVPVETATEIGGDSAILSAAKATEVAGQLEGTARPAFSYLMLGALRGWADDGDGRVTVEEALHYTRRQLRGVKGRQQTPQADGNLQRVLARGVTEREPPAVVAEKASECAEGEAMRDGECVTVKATTTAEPTTADLTLEYLQRRLVFDGAVARQGGRILDGPAFYHAIGRPDLAAKWKSHIPALWISGIATTAAGITLMGLGFANQGNDSLTRDGEVGWFLGGIMGGFLVMAGGTTMITFGFLGNQEPMTLAERKSAAEQFNAKLREERGLGPEVDWQNEPANRRSFGPFSQTATPRFVGMTVRF